MDIFKRINIERNINGIFSGLCAAVIFAAGGIILKTVLFFMEMDVPFFSMYVLVFSVIIFAAVFFLRRGTKKKTAAKVDKEMSASNRLECAAELEKIQHPLKSAQLENCREFFRENTVPLKLFRVVLPLAVLIIFVGILASVPVYRVTPADAEGKNKPADKAENVKRQKDEKKKTEEAQEINFTAPESEMRAKPMDEIAFEGEALSGAGFSEITLKISVNAVLKKTVRIEGENFSKPGKVEFSGEFYLDELEVNPFDLVTYHLEAYSANDKDRKNPVISLPQFIEVRPFREDAFLAGGGNLEKQKGILEMLVKFLNNQIVINKSSYLAKASTGRVETKVLAEELKGVTAEQEALYEEISKFIKDIKPEEIPAESFYSIKQAAENMKLAKDELEKISSILKSNTLQNSENSTFDRCFTAQHKAIAELIQAMKNVKKIIAEGTGTPEETKENPFKDKQKFEKPEIDRGKNPEQQLQQLKKEQEEVLRELEKETGESNSEASKKQSGITDKLEKITGEKGLRQETEKHISEAAEASRTAEKALSSNEKETAKASGMKALSEMKKALNEINENSDKETADAAEKIKKDINQAERKMKNGNKSSASKSLDNAMSEAIDAVRKQAASGKLSNAEKLNETAKAIKEGKDKVLKADTEKSKEEFRKLKKEISSSLRNEDALKGLRESLDRLEELSKELKYLERNKTTKEMQKVFEDMQIASQEAGNYAEELSGGGLPAAGEMDRLLDEILENYEHRAIGEDRIKATLTLTGKIISDGNALLANVTGNKQLNIFTAEDAPPEYRKAVSKYFERLSEGIKESEKKK